ncbi:AAA family ATPase [Erwinia rhapontici]|uniref:AAA family ATPase n=1 Tax=Erwinia rhapontici TaxID=55212 RepID=UPI001D0D8587|nr:AAA family ATPase [Erwinia rhapontici]UDQ80501.1 AAA family ATPase [Erwinia rhapontici]
MKQGTFRKNTLIDGQFQVLAYLGASDFCELYRVEDRQQKVKFLKLISAERAEEVDLPALAASLRWASALKGDNIIQCYPLQQSVTRCGIHYFTMDFVSGERLSTLLSREIKLASYESYQLTLDLLDALISTGDQRPETGAFTVTPNHIFIDYAADLRRALWLPVRVSEHLKSTDAASATSIDLACLAPEALLERSTHGSPLFSIICVLYRCLTGHHAWEYPIDWQQMPADDIRQTIALTRSARLPRALPNASAHLTAIVQRALNLAPDQRYPNAEALKRDILSLRDEMFTLPALAVPSPVEALSPPPGVPSGIAASQGFASIAGMDALKSLLDKDIIAPLNDKALYQTYGIQPLNGMLFYGPPGCGKTYIAQKLAEELGFFYLEIKPSDLASTYIHGTQEKIGNLFRRAKTNAPTLIFIDEVDAVLPDRESDQGNHGYAAEVNEFLAQMTNCNERGIFIVAATNRPEMIDPAILRTGRLDKLIYIGLPDFAARYALFTLLLKNRPTQAVDINSLAMLTEGYVTSDLSFMVNEAAKLALEKREPITDRHFSTVRAGFRPSVSEDQINRYASFQSRQAGD